MASRRHFAAAGRKRARPPLGRGAKARAIRCDVYNGIAAYAQFVGRNYKEAIRLAGASIRLRSDHVGGYRMLAAAAAMAGQADVATVALHELRCAQPNFSLAWITQNMPFKYEADRDHYLEAFRRAGGGHRPGSPR
jgi:ferritin-like metal-binding protein YciE